MDESTTALLREIRDMLKIEADRQWDARDAARDAKLRGSGFGAFCWFVGAACAALVVANAIAAVRAYEQSGYHALTFATCAALLLVAWAAAVWFGRHADS